MPSMPRRDPSTPRPILAFALALLAAPGLAPAGEAPGPRADGTLTYAKDIAPIVYRRCSSCHRPGEVAPFSLLSYRDVSKRAGLIAELTEKRSMPPWKAEPGSGPFEDERRLTDGEIALIS